jgi:hypothetical protein
VLPRHKKPVQPQGRTGSLNDAERRSWKTFSDVDENAGSRVIVVPVTAMAAVLDKRVVMVVAVVPAPVVMIISHGARGTGGYEENGQGGTKNISLKIFHFSQYTGNGAWPLWGLDPSDDSPHYFDDFSRPIVD